MSAEERIPVSAFIIAKDEAHRIGRTIDSVRDLVDEVIVVEWGSSDQTVEVARRHGAQVIQNPWQGYGPQKRFAESRCRCRWLLNLDADEELSPELQAELRKLFRRGPVCSAYRLTIRATCWHEERPSRWAYANRPIRLYDKKFGRFAHSLVHDSVIMQPGTRIGTLKRDVWHRGFASFEQLVTKINSYTTMQAQDYIERKSSRISWWRMLTVFPSAFFKSFILRRHFVWGRYGFAISMCYAFARVLRLAKIHEQAIGAQPTREAATTTPTVELRRAA